MHIVCYTDGCLCSIKYIYIYIYIIIKDFSNSVEVTTGYMKYYFRNINM